MALTHAQIVTEIELQVWQSVNTTITDALIKTKMTAILKLLSKSVPFRTDYSNKSSYTFDGVTRDLALTDWDYDDLVPYGLERPDSCEYNASGYGVNYARIFRNTTLRGRTLSIALDSVPDSGKTVYLYPDRLHIVQEAIGTTDTAGTITGAHAIGVTSLTLGGLGTGTVNKYTKLTIAGDTTEYMVKATATIAANAATVTITPPLVVAMAGSEVVTLALNDGTLSAALEEVYIKYVAGALLEEYAQHEMTKVSVSAGWRDWLALGQKMVSEAKAELKTMAIPGSYVKHPTS